MLVTLHYGNWKRKNFVTRLARRRCADALSICLRPRRRAASRMACTHNGRRKPWGDTHGVFESYNVGYCIEIQWSAYRCYGLWTVVQLWIARPRRRANRRLLGGKAILETRHLHRSAADDARPRSAHNRHSLVRQRAFCRQSGFGQGDGKMRFRANRRNLHIADPRHRLRPPDSRPSTMAVRYRL